MRYDLPMIMEQELQYINRELEYLEQSPIKKMSGSLAFVKHKGDIEYAYRSYNREDHKRTSVNLGNAYDPRVIQVKQNAYNTALRNSLLHDKKLIEKFLSKYRGSSPEDVDKRLKPVYRDVTGQVHKNSVMLCQRKWADTAFEGRSGMDNKKTYIASDGTRMLSKSELILYEILNGRYEVPLRHEACIKLVNKETGILETRYPDFMFMMENGDLGILEHCGMLREPGYFKRAVGNLKLYIDNGFVLNENLFYTVDDSEGNLNVAAVEQYIRAVILPKINSRKWKPV